MSQLVQGAAVLGYVANNSRVGRVRDILLGHLDRAAGTLGGGDVVLPAAGGLAVSPVSQRRARSFLTPDVKRARFSSRVSPALRNRIRSRLGNRRRRAPLRVFRESAVWSAVTRTRRWRKYFH